MAATATAAATTLLESAAPCQFDDVAQGIQKIGEKSLAESDDSWLTNLQTAKQKFELVGKEDTPNVSSHPLAKGLRIELVKYQEQTFGSQAGVIVRGSLQPGSGPNDLHVHTFAEKNDRSNLYSGYWKAVWNVTTDENNSAQLSGEVRLHTMSYEDGNHQMKTTKVFPAEVVKPSDNDGTLEGGIVEKIVDWESQVLGLLANLHGSTKSHLRSIRRVLPITRTKMNWHVEAQRGVKLTKKSVKNKENA